MAILTFRGGIHPWDGKMLSKDELVKKIYPSKDLVYPVSQHAGEEAVPVVKPGDRVLAGEKIARGEGFMSADIHASVSGRVKTIEPRITPEGNLADSIIIENDGLYEEVQTENVKPLEELTKEEIRKLIREAGIVGMKGGCVPTHTKLTSEQEIPIDTIIVNASESEPYLTSDYRRMVEMPEKIVDGLRVCLKLFEGAKGIIAIEDNKPEAVIAFKRLVKKEKDIKIKPVYTKYPQGSQGHLIYTLTKRKTNSSITPAQAGCIVENVETIYAIARAVLDGKPLISRIITVTGNAVKTPGNFEVLLGTEMNELIEAAGGFLEMPEMIVHGGPMRGSALTNLEVPVIKGTTGLFCMLKEEYFKYPGSCINCGSCVSVCPGRLLPTRLEEFAVKKNQKMFEHYDGMECCECACCSYICPAKRNPMEAIRIMKEEILMR